MNSGSNSVEFSLHKYSEHILDLISDGIYISDRNGCTLRINAMYERLTGLKKSYLIGRNVDILTSEGGMDTILNPQIVKTGKPGTIVQTGRKGKKLVLNGYPIFDNKGAVALVVTFVRDVTLMNQLRKQILTQRKQIEKYRTNVQYINQENDHNCPLIIQSPAMVELNQKLENLAATDATILLQGETGVGKDVYARRIHQTSNRSGKPFVKVDCPTIPEALFESELFGYAPGAFSGAHAKGKLGFFAMADKGTLFLDEIGELPLAMQAKLLRVLQDREFVRVGSTKNCKLDVRVISATNRDLEKEVEDGRFRSDLFYRLRVAFISIPPLRKRQTDIVLLAKHFLDRYNNRYKRTLHIEPTALNVFTRYQWPGNIREMENLIQSLVISNQNAAVRVSDLPSSMVGHVAGTCQETPLESSSTMLPTEIIFSGLQQELKEGTRSLKSIMADIEHKILIYSLKKHGSHAKVAKRFKMNRSTLFRKLASEHAE